MTSTFVIAGLVLGFFLAKHFIHKLKGTEKSVELLGINLLCPGCGKDFKAADAWLRDGLMGRSIFSCPACGVDSKWDMTMKPPRLKGRGKK